MSSTPISSVTNIMFGLFSDRRLLIFCMISAGSVSSSAVARIRVRVTAMNSAAGTPLSDTSPMARHNRPSGSVK